MEPFRFLSCFLCFFALLVSFTFAEELPFKVGVAQVDITGPLGVNLSGYLRERPASAVHDPLYAKVLAFCKGDQTAILIVCDLNFIEKTLSDLVRDGIAAKIPVSRDSIAITGTHTHTGPEISDKNSDYVKVIVDKMINAAVAAYQSARETVLESCLFELNNISFNRRYLMKDGSVALSPGYNNPDIVRPVSGIDPETLFILFKDAHTEKPFAGLSNFALHLDTVGGTEYSADYPYYISETLKKRFGDDFISVFATGTCGDINHFDMYGNTPVKTAKEIGTIIGEKILSRIDEGLINEQISFKTFSETISIPRQTFSEEQIAEAKKNEVLIYNPSIAKERGISSLDRTWYKKVLLCETFSENIDLEIFGVRFSDHLAFVTTPGELFVDLGKGVKKESPFARTMIIELANISIYYVPTKSAFNEGSPETINSFLVPGGGEILSEKLSEFLKKMAL